jgi:trimeric autotransporter adhesin
MAITHLQTTQVAFGDTANGYAALVNNTGGSANTANGYYALFFNINGSGNTANGFQALNSNTSGSGNTAGGEAALYSNTSGSYNTALGYLAGSSITTGSSNIDIGNQGFTTDTNIIRIGSSQSQTFIAGVINGNGMGLANLNASQLTSVGNTNGGSGNFFVGPSGNSTTSGFNDTAMGLNALTFNASGYRNTANGFQALFWNTNGSDNTAIGNQALQDNTSGGGNTAIGSGVLLNNTSGSLNTANGAFTLGSNTNGYNNTASGAWALEYNTSGSYNIALGVQAGINCTGSESSNIDIGNPGVTGENNIIRIGSGQAQTFIAGVINGNGGGLTNLINVSAAQLTSIGNTNGGSGNFFVGQSGNSTMSGSNNTANGYDALGNNMTGSENTANGSFALAYNEIGSYNTANGVDALLYNSSGSQNTACGFNALYFNQGSFNTAIGSSALSNNVYGYYNTAIGQAALAYNTSGFDNIALGYQAGYDITTGSFNIDIGNPGASTDTNTIRIGNGQTATYIAGISPVTLSPVGGPVYINVYGQLGTINSSRRFKEAIRDMGGQSDVLLPLRPVAFHYKPDLDPQRTPQYGLIAEEVEKVAPQLVLRDAKGEILSVRYEQVNAMLLNEFLKEHRRVEQLESRLEKLEQLLSEKHGGGQ